MVFALLGVIWRLTSIASTTYAHRMLDSLGDGHCVMTDKSTKLLEVEDGFRDRSCYPKRLDPIRHFK